MPYLSKLVSPVGFGLVLLLFLLPFVGVACQAPGVGSIDLSYSGLDLATGGDPSIDATGQFDSEVGPVEEGEPVPKPDVALLTVLAAVLLAGGLVAALLPALRARPWVITGIALLSGAVLVLVQALAQANLVESMRTTVDQTRDPTVPEQSGAGTDPVLEELVGTRIGFWLALVVLAGVAGYTVATARLARRRPAGQTGSGAPPDQ